MAVGVASPKAQGQAIINTETKAISAKAKIEVGISAISLPNTHQKMKEAKAMPIINGTKIPAI